MSSVIVKENESIDSALRRFKRIAQRLVSSRKFVRENTTKSQALSVRRNQKLQESANIINFNFLK